MEMTEPSTTADSAALARRVADAVSLSPPLNRPAPRPGAPAQRPWWGGDRLYHGVTLTVALCIVAILAAIVAVMVGTAWPAFGQFGFGFLTGTTWNLATGVYGALPFLAGSLITTGLALLLAGPISLAISLLLTEYAPARLAATLGVAIDVAAGVPTVVFGAWALLAVVPWLANTVEPGIASVLGWLPIFAMPPVGYFSGYGMLTAGLVLAAMIFPTIVGVSRSTLLATPVEIREASLAMGATRWETATRVVLRQGRAGVIGAVILACGRALGETMAVASIIGNAPALPHSLFDQGATLATQLFNQGRGNASPGTLSTAALYELAVILLVLSALTSLGGRLLTRHMAGGVAVAGGGR